MFKSGPLTSIVGTVIIVLTWLNQIINEQGIPKTGKEWVAFLVGNATGLAALFAKDFNKTNSQHPTKDAHNTPDKDVPKN